MTTETTLREIVMMPLTKKVTFLSEVEIIDVHHVDKPSDRRSFWYSRHDLLESRNEKKKTLQLLKSNQPLPSDFCERGLEKQISIRTQQLAKAQQVAVIQAVLNEQGIQRYMGVHDDIRIAKIASSKSKLCQQAAIQQGKRDFEQVYDNGLKKNEQQGIDTRQCYSNSNCHREQSKDRTLVASLSGLPIALIKKQTVAATPA